MIQSHQVTYTSSQSLCIFPIHRQFIVIHRQIDKSSNRFLKKSLADV